MAYTLAGEWLADGARFLAFTRPVGCEGHFGVAVQVERNGQTGPLLSLHGQGYPDREAAVAAAIEVLQLCCGMPHSLA